ncbi:MAG: cytochrome c [Proteobacteria bacterium]|nr:cytochrome c [Pseudomonadota bacterium]
MVRFLQLSFTFFLALESSLLFAEKGLPDTYGMGRTVAADEIAAWDIDVRPDGRGLPKGNGSVQKGGEIYAQKCALCHGASGTEGPFDVLVGRLSEDVFPFAREPGTVKTIGNYWPYATTVFDYINRAMPFTAPGSLRADEVYALVAYLLHLNAIVPANTVLSQENLPAITMPARHRFVLDDRRGGPEVR